MAVGDRSFFWTIMAIIAVVLFLLLVPPPWKNAPLGQFKAVDEGYVPPKRTPATEPKIIRHGLGLTPTEEETKTEKELARKTIEFLAETLTDPDSLDVRSIEITTVTSLIYEPEKIKGAAPVRWIIKIDYRAKNSYGAYIRSNVSTYFTKDRSIVAYQDGGGKYHFPNK